MADKDSYQLRHEPVWLIDSSIYFFRYYFSLEDFCFNEQGQASTAAFGFCRWLLNFLCAQQPKSIALCFDESLQTCFRNDIYSDYKSSRALPDENIIYQLEACKTFAELCGLNNFASNTHEADDLISTLAARAASQSLDVAVISRDKDLSQIINCDNDFIWDFPKGEKKFKAQLESDLGAKLSRFSSIQALTGDKIDDIPGVPGIGLKTAVSIYQHFEHWHQLRDNIEGIENLPIRGAKKVAEKILLYRDQIDIAFQLADLDKQAPIAYANECEPGSFLACSEPDLEGLKILSDALGFKRNIISAINDWEKILREKA